MRTGIFLTILLIGTLAFSQRAAAHQEKVWTGILFANNEPGAKTDLPKKIRPFVGRMQKVFGYRSFELIGQHTEIMDDNREHWLIPTKQFFFSVTSVKRPEYGYHLHFALYHQKKLLVKAEVRLARKSPLLIRGPLCGKGQIVIVLLVE